MSETPRKHRNRRILAALFAVGMAFFLAEYREQMTLSAFWTAYFGESAGKVWTEVPVMGGTALTDTGASPETAGSDGAAAFGGDTGSDGAVLSDVPASVPETAPAVPPYTAAESVGRETPTGETAYPLLPAMEALADTRIVQRIRQKRYRSLLEAGLLDDPAEDTEKSGADTSGTDAGKTGGTLGTAEDTAPAWGTYNPLNGLPMDADTVRVRPKAVVLNNIKKAQPQFGNSQADILYEVPAEGGVTRMLAVYQKIGNVGTIGSVRSARRYLVELAMGHDALLIHAGGSPEAYQDIADWKIDNLDGVRGTSDASIFWRDAARRKSMGYEHSLMTSGIRILTYLYKGRYRTEHPEGWRTEQTFAARNALKDGEWARHMEIRCSDYKTGVFDYDAESGEYLVSQYGEPYRDGGTGEQVHAANVLILKTDIARIPGDKEKRLTVRTTGEGRGWFFHSGRYVSIRWSRADRNSPFVYTRLDGTPLTLGQGMSYVCIVNADAAPVVSANAVS